jgi:hypothetical protein
MTPSQAELIFYEYGELLENNLILYPEKYTQNLKTISRNELRRAIMLWVAQQKFEGKNILHQSISSSEGKKVAILELAVDVWHMTNMFQLSEKSIRDGTAKIENSEDRKRAAKEWDEFQDLIIKIDSNDSNYWNKIFTQTQQTSTHLLPLITEESKNSKNPLLNTIGFIAILIFLTFLILLIAIT